MLIVVPSTPQRVKGPSKLDVIDLIISDRVSTKEYLMWFPMFVASLPCNSGEGWCLRSG